MNNEKKTVASVKVDQSFKIIDKSDTHAPAESCMLYAVSVLYENNLLGKIIC